LFLGAGVSKQSGIPDWGEVLNKILQEAGIRVAETEPCTSIATILEVTAKIPRTALLDLCANECESRPDKRTFESMLRGALYGGERFASLSTMLQGIPFSNRAKTSFDWRPVLDELKKNTTLAAVGDLITEEESPGEVHKNAKIHAVLTTNVDGGDEST
jgi:hypothetical protein